MTLEPGSRLGPYEITAKLGEGGMGEVYRARDTQLDRDVAIKTLPAAFTEDPERLARFEREAKLLAQLHHPNIASIFGLEEADGGRALVMELVEGPTLDERLQSGSLPLEDSLSIARQIAEALEEAHEKGIVHRDLKPQNIKITAEGKVKVLDFGLAKAMDPSAGSTSVADLARSPTLLNSPTLTAVPGTQLGVILGTAAYMSPEQARGGAVDKRADIWAFGVVLWEMLVGRSLFAGATVTDILAGVLKTEIDFAALPGSTPPAIRRLLRRCLERNPRNRLHDIADARIVIDEVLAGVADPAPTIAPSPVGRGRRELAAWALAALATVAAGALLWSRGSASAPSPRVLRVALPNPQDVTLELDGESLLYLSRPSPFSSSAAGAGLEVARLGSTSPSTRLLDLATNAVYADRHRLYSQDGALVAQPFDPERLQLSGRPTVLVDDLLFNQRFAYEVFSAGGLRTIAFLTGEQSDLSRLVWRDRTGRRLGELGTPGNLSGYGGMALSGDGRWAAIARVVPGASDSDLWIFDLERGTETQLAHPGRDEFDPIFSPDSRILFYGSVWADRKTLVRRDLARGTETEILSTDADGEIQGQAPMSLSPDGAWLTLDVRHFLVQSDVALLPAGGGAELRMLFATPADEAFSQISPDGRWLAWSSDESGRYGVYVTSFPEPGSRVQVSRAGGIQPRWNPHGGEIYFKTPDNVLTAVPIELGSGTVSVGTPEPLFAITEFLGWTYAVAPDGDRFLVREPITESAASPINLLTDWTSLVGDG